MGQGKVDASTAYQLSGLDKRGLGHQFSQQSILLGFLHNFDLAKRNIKNEGRINTYYVRDL